MLAHELAHVGQQRRLHRPSDPAGLAPILAQRQQAPAPAEWLPELDGILPERVGLISHIHRVVTLIDIVELFRRHLIAQEEV